VYFSLSVGGQIAQQYNVANKITRLRISDLEVIFDLENLLRKARFVFVGGCACLRSQAKYLDGRGLGSRL
jgi:hypothetical protein